MKGRSTLTGWVELLEDIINNIENGYSVSGIFVDMSKAFDCLGHELILSKLSFLGIDGRALCWFSDYLEDRSQIVEISHVTGGKLCRSRSCPLPVRRGVPQGSVFGSCYVYIVY
ncbi:uncharacterized protein LOC124372231 [Homalodisca vitripennis]|uniref:uncharacterized protein LOC124372231 n=1 Tax=Homalodisca vitripennis TaxID=197043 RepID=UPI001EEA95F6|nr:uncharacterized protein LOC124372231 [Homalodisca vitripennis]